jgi:hypothetical protein
VTIRREGVESHQPDNLSYEWFLRDDETTCPATDTDMGVKWPVLPG